MGCEGVWFGTVRADVSIKFSVGGEECKSCGSKVLSKAGFAKELVGVRGILGFASNTSPFVIVGEFKNRCHHYVKVRSILKPDFTI
jgi:hypothetical protein